MSDWKKLFRIEPSPIRGDIYGVVRSGDDIEVGIITTIHRPVFTADECEFPEFTAAELHGIAELLESFSVETFNSRGNSIWVQL